MNMGQIKCSSTGSYSDQQTDHCIDNPLIITKGECSSAKKQALLDGATETEWTQFFVPEVLCIPEEKPDIEELMSVSARVQIISQRVIRTPTGLVAGVATPVENQEGTILTGRKLIIEGILRQKIMYTACNAEQSVHTAHFDVPFSAFIVLEVDTPLNSRFKIDTCIEDIFVSRVTDRQIFKNVTIFIKATELVCP